MNNRTAEEMPRHIHWPAAGVLRGIPIDWSEGHFIWAREGCECVVKFCPQHCRELIGTASSDHESDDGSTPGPSLRVDESDPYGLSSSSYNLSSPDYGLSSNDDEAAEGPKGSGRHDVDDDHNGEVDNDADGAPGPSRSNEDHDDRKDIQSASNEPHNASVLPSTEGVQQSGSASPTLSASAEDTAQDDPEATISPDNRHETENTGPSGNQDQPDNANPRYYSNEASELADLQLPGPQIPPYVQRPEQQPPPAEQQQPPPAALGINIDPAYLASLSPELRERVLALVEAHSEELRALILPAAAPAAPASATASAPPPAPPRLPAVLPAGSAQQTAVPVYQTNRHLAREIRHLAREARALSVSPSPGPRGHLHQRSPSDILAKVLNTSPSPAKDSSQAVRGGGEGGSVVGCATSRTPAQPGPSQPMPPPMGFFSTSTPKPVARRLFSRPDPPQLPHLRPTPAPGTASAHTADKVGEVEEGSNGGEASEVGESSKVGERSGMVTRSQGRRGRAGAVGAGGAGDKVGAGGAGSAVDKVGGSSKVGKASGMVTRSQGRRGRRAGGEEREERRDALDEGYQTKEGTHDDHQSEQEEEQDIQDKEPSGSNRGKKLEEESSEEDELAAETTAPTRPKRGRPRKSGNTTYTYGKRNKRRKL